MVGSSLYFERRQDRQLHLIQEHREPGRGATRRHDEARHGSGAIRVPDMASVTTIAMSATEDVKTQTLGFERHMRRRSRST